MKGNLRFKTLAEAMTDVQDLRASEVGGHTWQKSAERYGISYLWVEMAAIMSRLEQMLWVDQTLNPYSNPNLFNFDRALDLCIDLGNYTDFLYRSLQSAEETENKNEISRRIMRSAVDEVVIRDDPGYSPE
jgi:hypothetical protein